MLYIFLIKLVVIEFKVFGQARDGRDEYADHHGNHVEDLKHFWGPKPPAHERIVLVVVFTSVFFNMVVDDFLLLYV